MQSIHDARSEKYQLLYKLNEFNSHQLFRIFSLNKNDKKWTQMSFGDGK